MTEEEFTRAFHELMERANAGDRAAQAQLLNPSFPPEVRSTAFGNLQLVDISPPLRDRAVEAFERGDAGGFLNSDNMRLLRIVSENTSALRRRGIYESALLYAYTARRENCSSWSMQDLRGLFGLCDRDRLRAAGQPMPGPGPFKLFRGVAGAGAKRRPRGFSWTSDLAVARFFAIDFASRYHLPDPGIVSGLFSAAEILVYTNERKENEFIIDVPPTTRFDRVL